jgi:diphthine synthase
MLHLVGLGLNTGDIPQRSLELCKKCEIYVDNYTSLVSDEYQDYLRKTLGKDLTNISRSTLEEEIDMLLNIAKNKEIAVLVAGDPLIATTHKVIFIAAKKKGVEVRVHHAASILSTLMGESGLDFYRFGSACTIAAWSQDYKPVSFYETIQRNVQNNLHTVIFLDYDSQKKSSLDINEAIHLLFEAEKHYKKWLIYDDMKIMVLRRMSFGDQQRLFITIKEAAKMKFEPGPAALIYPAKLTEVEKEVIACLY